MKQQDESPESKPLVEGLDYYMEKGLFVLTEHFLLRRGFCCGNGCRHCPYRKPKEQSIKKV